MPPIRWALAVRRESEVRPDFMIIGAMKCGTSTLQVQLARQDGVFMTTPKEPNFFSDDKVYARGADWYRSLFDGAAPGDLKGEASTHYTKRPTYPDTLTRMQPMLPDVRLIYMIRNPVARAVSHYVHAWSIDEAGDDPEVAFDNMPELVDYGRYGMQIAPFVEAYGIDRIHLTSLEQITADPDAEFARITAFLGLPDTATWRHEIGAQNVSSERMRRFPLHGLVIDSAPARFLRHALVPKWLRNRVRATRTMRTRPEVSSDHRHRLEQTFIQDRATMERFFPGHPALDLCYPFART